MLTPEFLCWAIERQCSLREMLPENQPDKVERHLRAARMTADALFEQRVVNDLATSSDGAMGFRVSEAIALYGGEEQLRATCSPCPANVAALSQTPSYAGCFGMFPVPEPAEVFWDKLQPADGELFAPTTIPWYGWWLQSPLSPAQCRSLAGTFAAAAGDEPLAENRPLLELATALKLCAERELAFSCRLYPEGEIDGVWWNLKEHCPVCRASWRVAQGRCGMCGQTRAPANPVKRRVRGTRPYRLLEQIRG